MELLNQLNMPQAQFKINLVPRIPPTLHRTVQSALNICCVPIPDKNYRALAKAASGGERSRISLALQVALSNQRMMPVLIFDEVDSGVGVLLRKLSVAY